MLVWHSVWGAGAGVQSLACSSLSGVYAGVFFALVRIPWFSTNLFKGNLMSRICEPSSINQISALGPVAEMAEPQTSPRFRSESLGHETLGSIHEARRGWRGRCPCQRGHAGLALHSLPHAQGICVGGRRERNEIRPERRNPH